MHMKEREIISETIVTKPENTFTANAALDPVAQREKPTAGMKGGKVDKLPNRDFVVQIGDLIEDHSTGEKFITITITNTILHYLHAGLGKYQEGFKTDSANDVTERNNASKVVDELEQVKNVLTGEPNIVPLVGQQEPNPKIMTTGRPNDPT